jgi:phage shock protein PspC (stress-responsive transcriptional regulator)
MHDDLQIGAQEKTKSSIENENKNQSRIIIFILIALTVVLASVFAGYMIAQSQMPTETLPVHFPYPPGQRPHEIENSNLMVSPPPQPAIIAEPNENECNTVCPLPEHLEDSLSIGVQLGEMWNRGSRQLYEIATDFNETVGLTAFLRSGISGMRDTMNMSHAARQIPLDVIGTVDGIADKHEVLITEITDINIEYSALTFVANATFSNMQNFIEELIQNDDIIKSVELTIIDNSNLSVVAEIEIVW